MEKENFPIPIDEETRHRHIRSSELARNGNYISGRQYLLVNSSIQIGVLKPASSTGILYRNALNEELFFIHRGSGKLRSIVGDVDFSAGDYLYVPKGTTYVMESSGDFESFFLESRGRIGIPARYLNIYGQIKEGAPYYDRDFRTPVLGKPQPSGTGSKVMVDFGTYYMVEERDASPFDVVGWDGYLFPFAISTDLMAPVVGKLHQPPPVHETFSGSSFMVGTFLPRKFDFHPRSIPISYYHSNIDTDEVLFYSSGNFMSRKGISPGSVTLHVRGLIHGPQPGAIEGAIGKEGTDEVAVMVEAYEPMSLTSTARDVEDSDYMKSWSA